MVVMVLLLTSASQCSQSDCSLSLLGPAVLCLAALPFPRGFEGVAEPWHSQRGPVSCASQEPNSFVDVGVLTCLFALADGCWLQASGTPLADGC